MVVGLVKPELRHMFNYRVTYLQQCKHVVSGEGRQWFIICESCDEFLLKGGVCHSNIDTKTLR